jgi:hypothetical protein
METLENITLINAKPPTAIFCNENRKWNRNRNKLATSIDIVSIIVICVGDLLKFYWLDLMFALRR